MTLNENQAIEVIKNPKAKEQIAEIKEIESELRVFTEVKSKSGLRNEIYWEKLMAQMKMRSAKKFERVQEFIRYPLPTVQISESILKDFFKVFEGKNRFFNVEANREIPQLKDWIAKTKVADWIEKNARKVLKNKPNSYVVIDRNEKGEVYPIFIDTERLVDVCFKDDEGNLEYIAFIHSQVRTEELDQSGKNIIKTLFSVYDDTTYYVYEKLSNSDGIMLVSSVAHGIGYCPAKSFLKTGTNSHNKLERRVAFSAALANLEDYTLFDIYRNYVDHYAPFPVTEAPINPCANPNCQDGKEPFERSGDVVGEVVLDYKECRVCKGGQDGSLIMPGTHIGIKVQADKTLNDGSGVFKMMFPDKDALTYVPEKLDALELKTKFQVVGLNNMSTEAINEIQVKGSFASMETILIDTKKELDSIYIWMVKTAGLLFYPSSEIYVDANFGTEFYLVSEDELQKRFDSAKKAGMPLEELLMIYIQLIETKYKGNAAKIERQKMLVFLDPLPMFTVAEVMNMKSQNLVVEHDLILKINFLNFIAKFEAENVPITQFGLKIEPQKRIEAIKESLNKYTDEKIRKITEETKNTEKGDVRKSEQL